MRSQHQPAEDKFPYIQFHMMATTYGQDANVVPVMSKIMNIKPEVGPCHNWNEYSY